jgi:hypothetical protein
VLVLSVFVAPAAAAPGCEWQVIDDWGDNGRVDGTYARHCYDGAIEALQPDVREYSSAEDEILRALQRLGRTGQSPPAHPKPPPTEGETSGPAKMPLVPPEATPTTTFVDHPKDSIPPQVAPPLNTASASSVPIPLLVLTGLALLLIAGGSAGYFVRRHQGRNARPPI